MEPITKYAMENIIVNSSALLLLIFLRMQHKSIRNSLFLDQKLFAMMLDLTMFFCFVESGTNLWDKERIFASIFSDSALGAQFDIAVNTIFNLLYFTITILFGYIWSLYSIFKIYASNNRVRRYARIISPPAIIGLLFTYTTPFTGWVFRITETNAYTRGPLFTIPAIATFAYLIFGIVYIYSNRRRTNKYMIMPVFLIATPIVIGSFVQLLLPGTAIIAMVLTISLVGLYASGQSESAYIDRLSGVYNRRYLDDYLTALNENKKHKEKGTTITGVMVDMDKFKQINDNFGHHMGDDAIAQVGSILRNNLGKGTFAARYGGDEFIIITYMLDTDSVETLMRNLTEVAKERNASGDYPYVLDFSYGYAQFTVGKEANCDGFMKRMDDNMYKYKVAKKAREAKEAEEKANAQ